MKSSKNLQNLSPKIGNNRVIGVDVVDSNRFRLSNKKLRLHARKEVILSGGAINSPQLLQMSGIGPAEVLKAGFGKHRFHSQPKLF